MKGIKHSGRSPQTKAMPSPHTDRCRVLHGNPSRVQGAGR